MNLHDKHRALLENIRACTYCLRAEPPLPHEPRPVIQGLPDARIRVIGQAPGTRVHESGRPFTDPSGDRLRDWMGVSPAQFYDPAQMAITPMGFCFPGLDEKGGDRPPRKECAPLWQDEVTNVFPDIRLTLLIGMYAQKFYLKGRRYKTLTETVKHWRDYGETIMPLPHPSWRNNAWIKKNPWFETDLLPELKSRVASALG